MKKIIALVFAMFFAVTAAAQNFASEKINQIVVEGKLEQTVFAGENIEQIKIVYENTGFGEYDNPEKTDIEIFENGEQKVVAGDEIKPIVFLFKNVRVDEKLSSFNTGEGSLKGTFNYSVNGNKLTVSGTVDGACAGV